MHQFAIALVQTREGAEAQINELLAPHIERHVEVVNSEGAIEEELQGFWDWFQIGGRWSGQFKPDYDPNLDGDNQQVCSMCVGTGIRKDTVVKNGCNVCHGTGVETLWPTEWKDVDGNYMPATYFRPLYKKLGKAVIPLTVITPDGKAYHQEEWDGDTYKQNYEDWPQKVLELIEENANMIAVVVDYHC